jgi:hypothetical protein
LRNNVVIQDKIEPFVKSKKTPGPE